MSALLFGKDTVFAKDCKDKDCKKRDILRGEDRGTFPEKRIGLLTVSLLSIPDCVRCHGLFPPVRLNRCLMC